MGFFSGVCRAMLLLCSVVQLFEAFLVLHTIHLSKPVLTNKITNTWDCTLTCSVLVSQSAKLLAQTFILLFVKDRELHKK